MPRQTPHRTPKDKEKDVSAKELVKLKSENSKLKHQVSRLRAKLNKEDAEKYDYDLAEHVEKPKEVVAQKAKCPNCNSEDLLSFPTPTKEVLICRSCKTKVA